MAKSIEQLEAELNALKRAFQEHQHTGLDSKTVDLTDQIEVQGSVTASDDSTVDTTYGTEEAAVLGNVRTRLGEVVSALQSFGILS